MKNSKTFLSIIIVFLLLFGLTACGPKDSVENQNSPTNVNVIEDNEPVEEVVEEIVEESTLIELTDGLGRLISLEGPAQGIISLAPSNTELLFAVGAGAQVVGREDFSNFPVEVLDLPTVGGNFGELNTEVILSLGADLVLVSELTSSEQVATLEELGLITYYISNPTDLEGLYDNMRVVALLTGHVEETELAIDALKIRVDAVLEVITLAENTPVVYYELDSTDPAAPWTTGAGTFMDTLITMAAGENLGAQFEGAWVQVSAEEIIAQDPELIILGNAMWGVTAESVAARPGWEALSAVTNNTIYPFNGDLSSRPGPRLIDGLEELARLIHPELFD